MSIKVKYGTKKLVEDIGDLTFGKLLMAHRRGEEMSQREFARLLGISPSCLCDLEKGRVLPSIKRAKKIAKKLKMSEQYFIKKAIQDHLKRERVTHLKISFA